MNLHLKKAQRRSPDRFAPIPSNPSIQRSNMNGQNIGAAYFQYMAEQKPAPMQPGERHAYIFADDEFVIDHERKVINLPTIGEVSFEPEEGDDQNPPSWIAAIVLQGNDIDHLVPGYCQPYSDDSKALLPTTNGFIRALPFWVLQRAREPRIQKLLAQQAAPNQKRGGFRGLLSRRR